MTYRLRVCVFCVLALITQFALLPNATKASDERQLNTAVSGTAPTATHAPGTLKVEQRIDRVSVEQGEEVGYDISVANTSKTTLSNVRILNMLPTGFRYKNGSSRINGRHIPDPVISTNEQTLFFKIGELAADGSTTIHFAAEVKTVGRNGTAVNYSSAISSGGGSSNATKSTVTVRENHLRTAKNPPADVPVSNDTTRAVSQTAQPAPDIPVEKKVTPSPPESPQLDIEQLPAAAPAVVAAKGSPLTSGNDRLQDETPPSQSLQSPAPADEKPPVEVRPAGNFPVPEAQRLAELIGTPAIAVLSDVDGMFIKSMSENNVLENESARVVNETTILESIRAGRNFNRESRAASARTEQAKAQTRQAFAQLLPSISVRANYGAETSEPSVKIDDKTGQPLDSDTHSRTDASLTVRQPLFDMPSYKDWQRRKVNEQARGENYRISDGDAYISTANAYLSLVSTRLQTDMTQDFEKKLADLLNYIEKRASAGAASMSDLARVRARRQATLSSRLEQESAHAAAGIEFVRLTNLAPRKALIPELDSLGTSQLPKSFDMAVATAMRSNPEITALAAELHAAQLDQSTTKGRYLPRVDAEYTESYSLHAGGATSSAGQRDQRIMMVLNWSLFNGGSDYYSYIERTARHKELQYRLDDQRRRVVQTLSANYATLTTTRDRIASGYQELKSISTAAEAMSKRMLSGNQSLLDLLDVYDRFYQVRSRLVSLHVLEMSTVAQLVRLTYGTPDTQSESK